MFLAVTLWQKKMNKKYINHQGINLKEESSISHIGIQGLQPLFINRWFPAKVCSKINIDLFLKNNVDAFSQSIVEKRRKCKIKLDVWREQTDVHPSDRGNQTGQLYRIMHHKVCFSHICGATVRVEYEKCRPLTGTAGGLTILIKRQY